MAEYQVLLLETDDQPTGEEQSAILGLPKFAVGMLINVHGKTYKVRDGGAARAFERDQEGHPNLIAVATRHHKERNPMKIGDKLCSREMLEGHRVPSATVVDIKGVVVHARYEPGHGTNAVGQTYSPNFQFRSDQDHSWAIFLGAPGATDPAEEPPGLSGDEPVEAGESEADEPAEEPSDDAANGAD